MSDLVKRIRDELDSLGGIPMGIYECLLAEAADQIEELEIRLDSLQSILYHGPRNVDN